MAGRWSIAGQRRLLERFPTGVNRSRTLRRLLPVSAASLGGQSLASLGGRTRGRETSRVDLLKQPSGASLHPWPRYSCRASPRRSAVRVQRAGRSQAIFLSRAFPRAPTPPSPPAGPARCDGCASAYSATMKGAVARPYALPFGIRAGATNLGTLQTAAVPQVWTCEGQTPSVTVGHVPLGGLRSAFDAAVVAAWKSRAQPPRYAALTCGSLRRARPGPDMVTRPWSST